EMDAFVKAHPNPVFEPGEPVLDGLNVFHHFAADAAFLSCLTYRGGLGVLTLVDESLRQLPAVFAAHGDDDDLDLFVLAPINDTSCGFLIPDGDLDGGRFSRAGPIRLSRRHWRAPRR